MIPLSEAVVPSAFAVWLDTVFANFDFSVFEFFGKLHTDWLTPIVEAFTHLGDSEFIIPLAVVGLILCLFKKTRKVGATLVLAIVVGTLITNVVMKPFVLRPRPFQSLADNAQYWQWYTEAGAHPESLFRSFPSGHTTGAFEIGMALFFSVNNKKIKWIFPVYSVLIGCSRLYLMVHYCTDVIGGMICGTVAAVIAFFIVKAILSILEKSEKGLLKKVNDFDLAEVIKSKKKA
ncbi:MAG: phosphatase PAP2 family protein [Clostridia bacterium]|nr:phosphatase PAP2 family protein [Clostridia bacterium]